MDGIELAGGHTGAKAEAAVAAGLGVTAADLSGGQAIGDAAIFKVVLGIAAAIAEHMGDHLISGGSRHAHDSSDLGSALSTRRSAGGNGSLAGQDGLSAAAAAGIAAAAAVGAGQGCLNLGQTGVYFHFKDLSGHGQDQTEHDCKYT